VQRDNFLRRILVPVDDSTSSLMAQENAAVIAKKTGASVTVFHVIQQFRSAAFYPQAVQTEIQSGAERRAEVLLARAKSFFIEEKVAVNVATMMGDPALSILELAGQDYDLIIMGACGEHETNLCNLGSVTRKVLRHARKPLLIVKKAGGLSNFLVCTDGSEHSIEALVFSVKLARKLDARITLINVQEGLLQAASAKTAEQMANLVLTATLSAIGENKLAISKLAAFGTPSHVIVDIAEKDKYDLVVLGSRGLGTAERFLLGSVSEDVSHNVKSSVLIIPPRQ